MKFLPLVWSNLKRKKVRTFLTFSSITVAFVLFGYLGAITEAFSMGVSVAGADRLIVRHKVSLIQPLPASYEARIEGLEGVQDATMATWFGGVYQRPTNFFAQISVNPTEYLAMYPEYLLAEERLEAWLSTRTGAIAGRTIADRYGWEVGDRIPLQATIFPKRDGGQTWEFDLVGIYDGAQPSTDTTQFLFRHDYLDEAGPEEMRGTVGWYYVRVHDPDEAAAVAAAINEEFANSPAETAAETEGAFLQGFAKQVGNIGAIMVAIISAVFFTILLVAGNTMAQAVRERVQEIGVLKAIGFTHRQLLGLVLAESCALAIGAGAVGLAISWYLISRGDPTGGALQVFFFDPAALVRGMFIAVVLGIATGLFPALQARRLEVAEALRRK